MEPKIIKDFRTYKESLFFGLNIRQFMCSAVALTCAAAGNFALRPILGDDIAGFCSFCLAVPFAAAAFFKFNGMTFEKFALVWLRQMFSGGFERKFKTRNYLYEACSDAQYIIDHTKTKRKKGHRNA
jgi:hypothetical protein